MADAARVGRCRPDEGDRPTLTTTRTRTILRETGELSDGTRREWLRARNPWSSDPDGIAEPLINALSAPSTARTRRGTSPVSLNPTAGQQYRYRHPDGAAARPSGIERVEFLVDGATVGGPTLLPRLVD